MKKIITSVLCVILIIVGGCLLYKGLSGNKKQTSNELAPTNPTLIEPMGVLEENTFIEVADVRISYNGDYFFVCNNRSDSVRISCHIVGIENDGEYEILETVGFYGKDTMQYNNDYQENGWAVEKNTNLVRPNETLQAVLDTKSFISFGKVSPQIDVDNDGYLDLIFRISPQIDDEQIMSSTDDPVSDIYRVKIQ